MSDTIKLGNLEISSFKVGSTDVDKIYLGSTLLYPSTPPHDYSQDYLTFENDDNANVTIYFKASGSLTKTISVSTDNGTTWANKTSSSGSSGVTLATLSSGEKLLVKGSNTVYGSSRANNCFVSSGKIKVSGNIMSLIHGDNFVNKTTLDATGYNFKGLFVGANKITSAENLILPAKTLARECYGSMFYGCTSLVNAPSELPAKTLTRECYGSMFYGCTSLVNAPELPATTLNTYCYSYMFHGCTSLTTAPSVLPATTLANYCYQYMFKYCNRITTAPELPATTLTDRCYYQMFQGCSSLNNITCLATDISASNCTTNWVDGVSTTGTFTKAASMNNWSRSINGIPTNWTVQAIGENPNSGGNPDIGGIDDEDLPPDT